VLVSFEIVIVGIRVVCRVVVMCYVDLQVTLVDDLMSCDIFGGYPNSTVKSYRAFLCRFIVPMM